MEKRDERRTVNPMLGRSAGVHGVPFEMVVAAFPCAIPAAIVFAVTENFIVALIAFGICFFFAHFALGAKPDKFINRFSSTGHWTKRPAQWFNYFGIPPEMQKIDPTKRETFYTMNSTKRKRIKL